MLVVEHRAIASVSIYRRVKPRVLSKIAATHSFLANRHCVDLCCSREAESPSALIDKRDELRACGVNVTDIVDHQWSKSIYFKDPHCLSLEHCCAARSRTQSSISSRWSARLVPSRVDTNQCQQLRNSTQHFCAKAAARLLAILTLTWKRVSLLI